MRERRHVRYCHTCGARLARDNRQVQCSPCQKHSDDRAFAAPDVPGDFWATDLMRKALASWHLGQVIRAYRHHPFHAPRPLSQDLVAGWLGLTQTQLSRIENGPAPKDLDKLTAWARALKIPPDMLWFRLPEVGAPALPDPPACESRQPAALLAGMPVGMPAPPWYPGLSGDSDAAAMRAFRAADLQVGGGHLYATVVNYLQTAVAPRLFGTAPAGLTVITAASALTEMAGWMAHDSGRDTAAEQHFVRALDLAMAGNDSQLRAHILSSMSHLALHQGRPEQAILLARRGQAALGPASPNPGLGARLLTMEARGLAALPRPEPAACGKTLLLAAQMLDKEPAEPQSPWISRFDEASLASEVGRCLHQLGQLEAAAKQAKLVINARPGTHARSRAFGQILLAGILVGQGQPEQACTLAGEVLDATQSLSSYLVVQQLNEVVRLLEPYRGSQTVADSITGMRAALRQRLWLYWLTGRQRAGIPAGSGP